MNGRGYYHPGWVSVWSGRFEAEEDLHEYVREDEFEEEQFTPFCTDLRVDAPLGFFNDPPGRNAAVRFASSLVEAVLRLPCSASFGEQALAAAEALGVPAGNSVVCVYDFDYFGKRAQRRIAVGRLHYLGSFPYDRQKHGAG